MSDYLLRLAARALIVAARDEGARAGDIEPGPGDAHAAPSAHPRPIARFEEPRADLPELDEQREALAPGEAGAADPEPADQGAEPRTSRRPERAPRRAEAAPRRAQPRPRRAHALSDAGPPAAPPPPPRRVARAESAAAHPVPERPEGIPAPALARGPASPAATPVVAFPAVRLRPARSSATPAASPALRAAEPEPVRIHIGRVEVRANLEPSPAPPRRSPQSPEPALSLPDYLRGERESR